MSMLKESKLFPSNRDLLRGRRLTEFFEANVTGYAVIWQFFRSMIEALKVIKFESSILSRYYFSITLARVKVRFRLTLRYVLCLAIILSLESTFRYPNNRLSGFTGLLLFYAFAIGLYFYTFSNPGQTAYANLSFGLCVFLPVALFWQRGSNIGQYHGLYSLGIVLMFCTILLLPTDIELALCLIIIHTATIIASDMFYSSPSRQSPSEEDIESWTMFDVFERINSYTKTNVTDCVPFSFSLECVSWFPLLLIVLYIKYWIVVRRRFAFFKLGKSVEARKDCESALNVQVRWIEAIMPSVVREEYQKLRTQNLNSGTSMWMFNKPFDNVSMLFADIVGFTRMSSNKTAGKVVTMLNNLFNRFDDLCILCQCEKIATLGDCYYCVSGCPIPRENHAVCCVEMGLGMCRIIKVFNCDFRESVSMRIGVHTGHVNAAIIGSQRYRFDVYSYDVIVASTLESTGRPGRVHVSQNVFELVKSDYNFSQGEPLWIKKEQTSGIAGMELITSSLPTYFIDPRSSQWRVKHEKFGAAKTEFHYLTGTKTNNRRKTDELSTDEPSSDEYDQTEQVPSESSCSLGDPRWEYICSGASLDEPAEIKNFEQDLELIHNLRTDPKKQYSLFQDLPLVPILMVFQDKEMEWHFHSQLSDHTQKVFVDSRKVAPIGDAAVCMLIFLCILAALKAIIRSCDADELLFTFLSTIILGVNCLAVVCILYVSTHFESQIEKNTWKKVYRFLSGSLIREFCVAVLTLMPTLLFLCFVYTNHKEYIVVGQRRLLSVLAHECILIHCVPLSSSSLFRIPCALISLCATVLAFSCWFNPNDSEPFCSSLLTLKYDIPYGSFCVVFLPELLISLSLTIFTTRDNELNTRLCFYVTREADISKDEAQIAADEARDMLYNIVPRYVHEYMQNLGGAHGDQSFGYAVSIEKAAVAFATISNFFSSYYREDYKGGENALKLLNCIVCKLDDLLSLPEMKDVEKIKTINDCYMVAAGLNKNETERNQSPMDHLVALMDYCHLILESLEEFNDMYIIGTDKFEVKIGYNIGPLIAGIIGTTKPMYDIWGNTVNVASRMYSTGLVGKIQVPEDVADELRDYFTFTYRGEVFVKGKGKMQTYLCEKST